MRPLFYAASQKAGMIERQEEDDHLIHPYET